MGLQKELMDKEGTITQDISSNLRKIIARIVITFGERPGTVSSIDIFEEGEGVTHLYPVEL